MDILSIVSFAIGLISFAASIVFFLVSVKSERRNQEILNSINLAIQNWQSEIMASSIELLNSRAEIVGKKVALADANSKHDFLNEISARIKYIVESPATGEHATKQAHNLSLLIECFNNATKSNISPEVMAAILQQPRAEP